MIVWAVLETPFIISPLFGRFKFLLSDANGKLNFKIGRGVSLENKLPDQVIKAGAQMVDNFAERTEKRNGIACPRAVKVHSCAL